MPKSALDEEEQTVPWYVAQAGWWPEQRTVYALSVLAMGSEETDSRFDWLRSCVKKSILVNVLIRLVDVTTPRRVFPHGLA